MGIGEGKKEPSKYTDALRGYAYRVLKRDRFKCRYCGLEGKASFDNWLALSWDHLLPKGHPERNNEEFIVASCRFCNEADNRYFDRLAREGTSLDGLSRRELVLCRKKGIRASRKAYREFWDECVKK